MLRSLALVAALSPAHGFLAPNALASVGSAAREVSCAQRQSVTYSPVTARAWRRYRLPARCCSIRDTVSPVISTSCALALYAVHCCGTQLSWTGKLRSAGMS